MRNYILTGTPGCGKSSIIRALEMAGASVVNEAATDIMTYKQMQDELRPWENPSFIDDIIKLQKHRQLDMSKHYSKLHFYDRSPICTYALAIHLGFKPSMNLMQEIERIQKNHIYEKRVFFVKNLGFINNTEARKISFEESLDFEQVHLDAYQKFDFECVMIPAGTVNERTNIILRSTEQDSNIVIRKMTKSDIYLITKRFAEAHWLKPEITFETYYQEQVRGERLIWIAQLNNQFAGYVTLKWQSLYEPFATAGIPEIIDLNVLPPFRKTGVGSMLLDTAEKEAATKSEVVGLGVGLYGGPDGGYGMAQKLYVNRGYIPDGKGLSYNYTLAIPGNSYPLDDDLILWFRKKLKKPLTL